MAELERRGRVLAAGDRLGRTTAWQGTRSLELPVRCAIQPGRLKGEPGGSHCRAPEALDAGAIEHALAARSPWPSGPKSREAPVTSTSTCSSPLTCVRRRSNTCRMGSGTTRRALKPFAAMARCGCWWDETPVDLFFSNLPIHDEAARHSHLSPVRRNSDPDPWATGAAFFKAMFDRTRDWADIEEMLLSKSFDPDRLAELIREHAGEDDHRVDRLDDAIARAGNR